MFIQEFQDIDKQLINNLNHYLDWKNEKFDDIILNKSLYPESPPRFTAAAGDFCTEKYPQQQRSERRKKGISLSLNQNDWYTTLRTVLLIQLDMN